MRVRSVSGAEKRWLKVFRTLNEFQARLFAADKALDLGRGGISRRSLVSERPELAEKLDTEAEYFERNATKMRYPDFRAKGLFVGSGVIEAGCKTVIGSRLKQFGNVLDCSRSQPDHRASLLPRQR